jgi:5,10-methylene-tetrahydrofolate dehydrogenase/methenyl tetrahydrofolate cyclohydrolase
MLRLRTLTHVIRHTFLTSRSYTAQIIDGKKIATEIKQKIKQQFERFHNAQHTPGLAVILVGDRKDSEAYVHAKQKAAAQLGFKSFVAKFDRSATQDEIIQKVQQFNNDPQIHGILVQLPLPNHIKEESILNEINVDKDVDGFHPLNMGDIATNRHPLFTPCTPKGCMELLERTGVDITGKSVVVIGRSNVVGLPLSLLLLNKSATVTICHSYTENIADKIKQADILIAACGQPEFVRGEWLKPGAIVIDVGINSIPDNTKKKGYRLVGDVCFEEAKNVASYITPVPGGVGPMTVAMLMQNTWLSFLKMMK